MDLLSHIKDAAAQQSSTSGVAPVDLIPSDVLEQWKDDCTLRDALGIPRHLLADNVPVVPTLLDLFANCYNKNVDGVDADELANRVSILMCLREYQLALLHLADAPYHLATCKPVANILWCGLILPSLSITAIDERQVIQHAMTRMDTPTSVVIALLLEPLYAEDATVVQHMMTGVSEPRKRRIFASLRSHDLSLALRLHMLHKDLTGCDYRRILGLIDTLAPADDALVRLLRQRYPCRSATH
jgi:hypothetical protein